MHCSEEDEEEGDEYEKEGLEGGEVKGGRTTVLLFLCWHRNNILYV